MAEEKPKTQDEIDKQSAEDAKKQSEAKQKIVDGIVKTLHDEFDKNKDMVGLGDIMRQVQNKIAAFQTIAQGAKHGPTEEQLKDVKFPVVSHGMSDGTPIANIAQAQKPGDKPEQPQEFVPKPNPAVAKEANQPSPPKPAVSPATQVRK